MKLLRFPVLSLVLVLSSCVGSPSITRTSKGGYHVNMGFVLLARRKAVIAEITTKEGDHLKYSTEEESGEDVPNNFIAAGVTKGLASIQGHTTDLKTTTDGRVALGAQGVQNLKATEKTKQVLGTFEPKAP